MKQIIGITFLLLSICVHAHEGGNFTENNLLSTMKQGDKAALLMVHFGTTYDDTRAVTIDAVNTRAKAAFSHMEVREAYTSRIVIRKLKERGVEKLNPLDALLKLRSEGYTHIVVQSTNIIDGVEMESLRRDVATVRHSFTEIRIGNPLLYSVEDVQALASVLKGRKPEKGSMVFVGHGTYTPATATYAMLDYIMKEQGSTSFHVGVLEGYPTAEAVLRQLKANKTKEVTLAPLMLVAGDHARNDIAGDWKEMLEKEGYKVTLRLEGLGEMKEVQEIFIEHVRFALNHKVIDIMDKKARYARQKSEEQNHTH